MTIDKALERTSNSLQNIKKRLRPKNKKDQPETSFEQFRSYVITPEDKGYQDHISYLNKEKDMEISHGDTVIHIDSENDSTIYAGPEAEQLIQEQDYKALK